MPTTSAKTTTSAKATTSAKKGNRAPRQRDAIALLKADHQQVQTWFTQFRKAPQGAQAGTLARNICHALRVHMAIEEEIFYPAFLEATEDSSLHHEAEIEHAAARQLMAQIEIMTPADDYFAAKVNVLGEMIRHHVKEEEKPAGMFAEARKADLDLNELGARLAQRKSELEMQQEAA